MVRGRHPSKSRKKGSRKTYKKSSRKRLSHGGRFERSRPWHSIRKGIYRLSPKKSSFRKRYEFNTGIKKGIQDKNNKDNLKDWYGIWDQDLYNRRAKIGDYAFKN